MSIIADGFFDWYRPTLPHEAAADVMLDAQVPAPTRCGEPQPWNKRICDRIKGHDGNHEAWLTLRRTRTYWDNPKGPVKYRVADEEDRELY